MYLSWRTLGHDIQLAPDIGPACEPRQSSRGHILLGAGLAKEKKRSPLYLTRLKVLFVGHKILLPRGADETNILSDKSFGAKLCENGGFCRHIYGYLTRVRRCGILFVLLTNCGFSRFMLQSARKVFFPFKMDVFTLFSPR